ncbi:hypothetical protein P8452_51959 [Trifolium repens]|nr:hypothetical protein P8452_51959 [Trifolium repens]
MVMLSFMSLGVGNSSCCKVKLRTRLCLVSCLWVLESQAKNLEKEDTQIWNKKIWKCISSIALKMSYDKWHSLHASFFLPPPSQDVL